MKKLQESGVEVVGISGDSVKNQEIFKKAHNLNFTLLADENGRVAKTYGVPLRDGGTITREVEGKEVTLTRGVTPARWTFVIDRQGKIAMKNTQVKAAEDSKAVLKAISGLN
jgi:peroxiredoxin Q/BCP